MKDRDRHILAHIVGYCDKLVEFTRGMNYISFEGDELCKDACALCVLQIGELVGNLTEEFKSTYCEMPWRQIRSMRNIIAHHYGIVDAETLWDTIQEDIPKLREYCGELAGGAL